MALEWVSPVGTVIAAGITAGFGGWLGGRHSRTSQERQHELGRKATVDERGRKKADEAIEALRFLHRHRREVAAWSNPDPEGDLDRAHEEFDRLGRAIEYLPDAAVRQQVELIHTIISDAWVVTRFGNHHISEPEKLITHACYLGFAVLGQYLRGEPTQAPSESMQALRLAHDSAYAEMARHHAEAEQAQREDEQDPG